VLIPGQELISAMICSDALAVWVAVMWILSMV
jgi:hypothetical protein